MKNKFNYLYSIIMQDINSKRIPIKKVDAMTPIQFIQFLKQFLPYVKNGQVDLKDVRVTQKIDGSAISICWINNDMMFESSYSGITTWDRLPYPDAGKFLYDSYKNKFKEIAKKFGNFKIKGELIWIDGMQQDGKVTPVAASYLTQKFGRYGGMVIFEILKIENNQITYFSDDQQRQLKETIINLNDENFSFYLSDNIILNQNVNFTLDVDDLLNLISNPEFNKEKFNKTKDAQLIQQIQKIQNNVVQQLSSIIDKSKGAFSAEEDLIQGIVLKINKTGKQYGIFSNGYKLMKNQYWKYFHKITPTYNEFLKKIFGYSQLKFIKLHWDQIDKDLAQNTLDAIKNEYIEKQIELINNIKNMSIPSKVKNTQISMAMKTLNKIKNLNSVKQFGKTLNEE